MKIFVSRALLAFSLFITISLVGCSSESNGCINTDNKMNAFADSRAIWNLSTLSGHEVSYNKGRPACVESGQLRTDSYEVTPVLSIGEYELLKSELINERNWMNAGHLLVEDSQDKDFICLNGKEEVRGLFMNIERSVTTNQRTYTLLSVTSPESSVDCP